MKTFIKLFLCLAVCCSQAQSIERQVIGSAGETLTNGTVSLDFTVGEIVVSDITNGTITLNQGFHQGSVILGIKVNPVAFLQGALLNSPNSLMRDDLRENDVPTTSPYSDALTCDILVFDDGGVSGTGLTQDNIVDWVFIELRDKNDNTLVEASTSALLQRDGDIVGVDGVSDLEFSVKPDDYFVVVRHRNHLSIMSTNTIALSNDTAAVVDFTDANNQITFGANAQTTFGTPSGVVAMWAGNVNGDTVIQYSGTTPDAPGILSEVLNDPGNFLNFPTYVVNGYNLNDVNMDSATQYSGTSPDTPFILQNVLAHPGNFLNFSTFAIQEQLPEN